MAIQSVTLASTRIDEHVDRQIFLVWCRIVGELSMPTPITIEDIPPSIIAAIAPVAKIVDSEEAQQREFARREGLDFDKEFGPIDPRARTPRCVHGQLFSEPCMVCAARCVHGLTQDMPCAPCGRGIATPLAVTAHVAQLAREII
jgi:hypothetical protein